MNCCASLTPLSHLNHKMYKESVSAIGAKNKFMDSYQPRSCMGARNYSFILDYICSYGNDKKNPKTFFPHQDSSMPL